MANFRYQALNADRQRVEGELEADTVQEAIEQLESGGLTVESIGYASTEPPSISIEPSATSDSASQTTRTRGSTSTGSTVEQEVLRSHTARILEQGKAIVPALRAYAEEMPPGRRRRQLYSVVRVLSRGDVTEATSILRTLPEYWIPLLSAATSSCDPGRILREFLEESRHVNELRQQWWLTLTYPFVIACIAAAVVTAISFLVIPTFQEMFSEFGVALPGFTYVVLTLSDWITSGKMAIVLAILLAIGALLLNAKRILPWSARDSIGSWFDSPRGRTTVIARFARFTADLLDAGLDIPDALRIAGFTTTRPRLRRASWRLANEMESGGDDAQRTFRYPRTAAVLHALFSEMATASRIRLLRGISDCHANRARIRLSWTRGIIEPTTICVIGVLVGGIVLGLFLPLISLITNLSG